MQIQSDLVGAPIKPYTTGLSARRTMNFAASVLDENAYYLDDERPGGIVAPPMIALSLTWPVSRDLEHYVQVDELPAHLNERQVHFSESLYFHRLMAPGDTIHLEGAIAAVLPHRAGSHIVLKYEAVNQRHEPVFTEYTGALLRDVQCDDGGAGKEHIPELTRYRGNSAIWKQPISVHPLASYLFDGCADNSFPIHISPHFAKSVGLPGIILHGAATLSYAVRDILNREAGGDPSLLREVHCQFMGMVFPGTEINVVVKAKQENGKQTDYHFEVLDHKNRRGITHSRVALGPPA